MFQNTEIDRSSVAQVCFTSEFQFQGQERKRSIQFVFTSIKPKGCLQFARTLHCTETEGPAVIWEVPFS